MPSKPRSGSAKRPKKKPVQERSRATWDAILEAAARILVQRGYASMTTNHVAARAGVSIGTLYEYFPNKDAIVYALLDAHVSEAEAALSYVSDAFLEAALSQPLSATVERLVATLVALHANNPGLHRVLFEEAARIRAVRERAEALEGRFVVLMTALLRRHREVQVGDPELSARIVVRVVESLVHGWVTRPDSAPAEPERLKQEIVSLVLSYVRSSCRAEPRPSRPPDTPTRGARRSW